MRAYINHSDSISLKDAMEAVNLVVRHNIKNGYVMTLSNGLAVDYRENTKYPSFYVFEYK